MNETTINEIGDAVDCQRCGAAKFRGAACGFCERPAPRYVFTADPPALDCQRCGSLVAPGGDCGVCAQRGRGGPRRRELSPDDVATLAAGGELMIATPAGFLTLAGPQRRFGLGGRV